MTFVLIRNSTIKSNWKFDCTSIFDIRIYNKHQYMLCLLSVDVKWNEKEFFSHVLLCIAEAKRTFRFRNAVFRYELLQLIYFSVPSTLLNQKDNF